MKFTLITIIKQYVKILKQNKHILSSTANKYYSSTGHHKQKNKKPPINLNSQQSQ